MQFPRSSLRAVAVLAGCTLAVAMASTGCSTQNGRPAAIETIAKVGLPVPLGPLTVTLSSMIRGSGRITIAIEEANSTPTTQPASGYDYAVVAADGRSAEMTAGPGGTTASMSTSGTAPKASPGSYRLVRPQEIGPGGWIEDGRHLCRPGGRCCRPLPSSLAVHAQNGHPLAPAGVNGLLLTEPAHPAGAGYDCIWKASRRRAANAPAVRSHAHVTRQTCT